MSQHRSLKGASTITVKRNVLKRFERVELLKKRGQFKPGDKVTAVVHPLRDGSKGASLNKITQTDTGQSFSYSIRDADRPNIDQEYSK